MTKIQFFLIDWFILIIFSNLENFRRIVQNQAFPQLFSLAPPTVNKNPVNPPDTLGQTTSSEQTPTTTVSPHNSGPTLSISELRLFNASIAHLRNEVDAIKNDKDVNDHKE